MSIEHFARVFWADLAPHQDSATTGAEVVAHARSVVVWHAEHEPDCAFVVLDEVPAFLAWLDDSRATLAAACDREYFTCDVCGHVAAGHTCCPPDASCAL